MARKPRGAKGRLASPAQMARLEALLQMQLDQPLTFEAYRHMLRSHMNPDSNIETELAAWKHLESRGKESDALVRFSQALHEEARASGTPPLFPEV